MKKIELAVEPEKKSLTTFLNEKIDTDRVFRFIWSFNEHEMTFVDQ